MSGDRGWRAWTEPSWRCCRGRSGGGTGIVGPGDLASGPTGPHALSFGRGVEMPGVAGAVDIVEPLDRDLEPSLERGVDASIGLAGCDIESGQSEVGGPEEVGDGARLGRVVQFGPVDENAVEAGVDSDESPIAREVAVVDIDTEVWLHLGLEPGEESARASLVGVDGVERLTHLVDGERPRSVGDAGGPLELEEEMRDQKSQGIADDRDHRRWAARPDD